MSCPTWWRWPKAHAVRGVTVVEHPVLAHRLAALRDQLTDRDHFRRLVSEISRLLGL